MISRGLSYRPALPPPYSSHCWACPWHWAGMVCSQQITIEGKQPLVFLSLLTKPKAWAQFLHPWQIRLANGKLWIHPVNPAKNIQVKAQKKDCCQQIWKLQLLSDQNLQKINFYMNFYFFLLEQLCSQIKSSLPSAAERNTAILKITLSNFFVNFTCKLFLSELKSLW